jgi:small conductance mechanosensitive channel
VVDHAEAAMNLNLSNIDLEERAIAVGSALLILTIGWIFASWVSSAVRRATDRSPRVSPTLVPLFAKLTRLLVLLAVVVAALGKLGIDTSGLFAALGAAGLAVGLALKDTVADVAAGVLLLVLRPFDIGEAVDIGGTGGVVDAVDILQTRLTSFEGVPVVLNNSAVRSAIIQNYSRARTRRIDIEIGIGYAEDIGKARAAIEDVLRREARVSAEPAILVNTLRLDDSAVVLLVRCFTKAADFWDTKLDLTRQIKERLDAESISIPYPQRDIHLFGEKAA